MTMAYLSPSRRAARAHHVTSRPVTSSPGSRGVIAPDWCEPCGYRVEREEEMVSLVNATHDLQMAVRGTLKLANRLHLFAMVRNSTALGHVRRLLQNKQVAAELVARARIAAA